MTGIEGISEMPLITTCPKCHGYGWIRTYIQPELRSFEVLSMEEPTAALDFSEGYFVCDKCEGSGRSIAWVKTPS